MLLLLDFHFTELYHEPCAFAVLEVVSDLCPIFCLLLGWDQSDKFVKIYITLTGVHQVPTENVQVHFTER